MSDSDLFIGSRVRLTSLKDVATDPRYSATHKPPKGKVYVAVVIGIEDKNPETNDGIIKGPEAEKRLRDILKERNQTPLGGTITSATGVMG